VSHLNKVPGGSGRSALNGGGAGAGDSGGGGAGAGGCGAGAAGASGCGAGAAGADGCGAGAAGASGCDGVAGPDSAKTRLAVKSAAWSTIPVSAYSICALKSLPFEQTKSSGTHKSMVLAAYGGPISISG